MSLFSKQVTYCASCGQRLQKELTQGLSYCDAECRREYQWRYTLSVMGKQYYPEPPKNGKD